MTINTMRIETMQAKRGLTQTELAARSGLSRQSLNIIIRRGTAAPKTVGKLAAGLGISVEELIGGEAKA